MPKVTIKRQDMTVETEVSFQQLKELLGVNGHKNGTPEQSELFEVKTTDKRREKRPINKGDFDAFVNGLSDRSKTFLEVVRDSPHGIRADELAPLLGFQTANQIGGVTGPGVVKIAEQYGFKAADIYNSVVTFPDGVRTRTFYPGKLLKQWGGNEEKPAV